MDCSSGFAFAWALVSSVSSVATLLHLGEGGSVTEALDVMRRLVRRSRKHDARSEPAMECMYSYPKKSNCI